MEGILIKRGVYQIETIRGMPCITLRNGADFEYYDPLTVQDENGDTKTGAPHVHLLHVNPDDNESIFEFVSKWGLLGLWTVEDFKDAPGMPPFGSIGAYTQKDVNAWYQRPHTNERQYGKMEPVKVFSQAVKQYQRDIAWFASEKKELLAALSFQKVLRGVSPGIDTKEGRWRLMWQFNSLYAACYFRVLLEDEKGFRFKRCKWCGGVFYDSGDSRAEHCPGGRCKTHDDVSRYRLRKYIAEVAPDYPDIDAETIENKAKELYLTKRVTGKGFKPALRAVLNEMLTDK